MWKIPFKTFRCCISNSTLLVEIHTYSILDKKCFCCFLMSVTSTKYHQVHRKLWVLNVRQRRRGIKKKTTRAEFLSLFTIKLNTVSFNADLTRAVSQASTCKQRMYTVKTMKTKHSKWKIYWIPLIGMLTKAEWLRQCLRRKQSDSHLKHKLCFSSLNCMLNRSMPTDAALHYLSIVSIIQCYWICLNWNQSLLLFLRPFADCFYAVSCSSSVRPAVCCSLCLSGSLSFWLYVNYAYARPFPGSACVCLSPCSSVFMHKNLHLCASMWTNYLLR